MEQLELDIILPASAETIYNDWLSADGHTAMTGGAATAENRIGYYFTAWDDYISGKNLDLVQNKFIKQEWRTVEFPEEAPDSLLEITFEEIEPNKTKLTLKQTNLQEGDAKKYSDGWKMHYFEPMLSYYSNR